MDFTSVGMLLLLTKALNLSRMTCSSSLQEIGGNLIYRYFSVSVRSGFDLGLAAMTVCLKVEK